MRRHELTKKRRTPLTERQTLLTEETKGKQTETREREDLLYSQH